MGAMATLPADEETERLASRLAALTGKPLPVVVKEAIDAYEANLALSGGDTIPKRTPQQIAAAFDRAVAKLAALPILDPRTADEIIGYDEFGLPR